MLWILEYIMVNLTCTMNIWICQWSYSETAKYFSKYSNESQNPAYTLIQCQRII